MCIELRTMFPWPGLSKTFLVLLLSWAVPTQSNAQEIELQPTDFNPVSCLELAVSAQRQFRAALINKCIDVPAGFCKEQSDPAVCLSDITADMRSIISEVIDRIPVEDHPLEAVPGAMEKTVARLRKERAASGCSDDAYGDALCDYLGVVDRLQLAVYLSKPSY